MSAPIHIKSNSYGAGDAQLYETLPEMVVALIGADDWLQTPRLILEPACGPGAITSVLQTFNHRVISSDLNQYQMRWKGKPCDGLQRPSWGMDFFEYRPSVLADIVGDRPFAIVTNPPYGTGERGDVNLAARFVEHALTLAPRVYMLLELSFIHGGEGCPLRDQLIDTPRFTGLYPFRERCNMHRDAFKGGKTAQSRIHAWYRWEREPAPRRSGMVKDLRRLSVRDPGPCPIRGGE